MRIITVLFAAAAMLAAGCAGLDAAHIKGQEIDRSKYTDYTDVEVEKQIGVQKCFERATDAASTAVCAMYGTATGVASTFGGRPTGTAIAPTSGQVFRDTITGVAPYAAAAAVVKSATGVQAKDPVVVQQPEPVIVRPEIVHPLVVGQ